MGASGTNVGNARKADAGHSHSGSVTSTRAISARTNWKGSAEFGAKVALIVAVGVSLPFLLPEYWLFLVTTWFAYAIAVMGLRVVFGAAGQLSLAQATFVGIGGYTAGLSSTHLFLTAPYELLLVVVVSGLAAVVVGMPALRVSGLRLALVTLAFGELFQWWLVDASRLTGGEQGLYVPPLVFGSLDLSSPRALYFLVSLFAGLCTLLVVRLSRTPIGRAMSAVRETEAAARSVGVRIARTKLTAFLIAGLFAGVSGWLLAHVTGSISPKSFDLFGSIYILVAVIIGGRRSTLGAWIGAAYVSLVPAVFASINQDRVYLFLSGILLILSVTLLPQGLVSLGQRLGRRRLEQPDST